MLVAISASKDFTAAQLMPPTLTRAAMLAIVIASAAANAEPIRFEVGGESLGELWLEPTIDLDAGIAAATLAVGTEREPIYYVLQVSSEPLDSDHIIVQQPPDHPDMRTRLDVTGAHFVLERSGPLVVGDEWELFGVDELVGEETITFSSFRLDVWDFGGLTNDQFGGHSILYVGLPLDVPDVNGDYVVDVLDLNGVCEAEALWLLLPALDLALGDIDGLNGVDLFDFLTLSRNFGHVNARYTDGDLDCSGAVDFADFLLLAGNFGRGARVVSVPEPYDVSRFLVISACISVLRYRRRMSNRSCI